MRNQGQSLCRCVDVSTCLRGEPTTKKKEKKTLPLLARRISVLKFQEKEKASVINKEFYNFALNFLIFALGHSY